MSKPGFYFYTGDWLKDTRCLTVEARGCWLDWLCMLHENNGTVTWPVSAFGQYCGIGEELARHILHQLELTKVADVEWQNDGKTMAKLSNRRMVREAENRERVSELRSEVGKMGAAKRWQKWQPSSSTSSSTSLNLSKKEDPLTLPGWLPETAWRQFKEHRQKLRKPLTRRAEVLAINRLTELRAAGHDPGAVIDNSILNGWQGLFAPRESTVDESLKPAGSDRIKRVLLRGLP